MADQSFLAASAQCTDGDFRNAAWCPLDPVFRSLSPPSELHHTKEVDSRQYKEDLGGGGQKCWWR